MGSSSNQAQTVGYRYHLGMHLVLCHGPVDALTEIQVAERQAWRGHLNQSGRIRLNQPELFGGEKREGGILGDVDVAFGEQDQLPNDYLLDQIGAPQPAYLGVLSLILRQVYIAANNPYIKPWAVRIKRCFRSWHASKAEIHGGANPAHMVYECLTNPDWGMGYPSSSVDETSFKKAADTLYEEGFGLNMIWLQQSKIEHFVQEIMNHIGGILTTSPASGRFILKLIRADYEVDNLQALDPEHVLELESYQRAAWGETTNELVLIYTKPETFKESSITLQDLANIQVQGAVVSQTHRYPGITSDKLAARVAMRDLAVLSTPLAKVRLKVNRQAWHLHPGDVFTLIWPALAIENLVLRVATVDAGTLMDGAISLEAVEDVFGLPRASYTAEQATAWVDPVPKPGIIPRRRLLEAPYWDIAMTLSVADMEHLDPDDCYLQALAERPPGTIHYEVHSKSHSSTSYTTKNQAEFCPTAQLGSDLLQEVRSTVFYQRGIDMDLVNTDTYAYIGDEVVHVTALDLNTHSLSLSRGVLDTVPTAHPADSIIWFADGMQGVDPTEYATAESIHVRMLSTTGKGTLPLTAAPTDTLTMQGRQHRPYPPGNVRINHSAYPPTLKHDLGISWSHRDRLSQTVSLSTQDDGNIGPEPGVSYTLRIYGENGHLQKTFSGLTGTRQSYSLAEDTKDSNLGRPNARLRIELEAQRNEFTSLQKHNITLKRIGYGLHYDDEYGEL